MTAPIHNPYADAMTPVAPRSLERTYFGQVVTVDAWSCVLLKGQGKIPFDPTQHAADKKATAINLSIECTRQDGSTYTVDQDTVNFAKDWNVTRASLAKLQQTLETIKGAFVQIKKKPSGRRFPDRTTGEMRDEMAIAFEAVYPDATTMQDAADAFYAQFVKPAADDPAIADAAASIRKTPDVAPVATPPAPSVDRAAAAQFLPQLWAMAGNDKYKFLASVRSMSMMAPFHDIDAPEMRAILGADFDEVPF